MCLPGLQILFEETLYQKAKDGSLLVDKLRDKGIILGIKVLKLRVLSSPLAVPVTHFHLRLGPPPSRRVQLRWFGSDPAKPQKRFQCSTQRNQVFWSVYSSSCVRAPMEFFD